MPGTTPGAYVLSIFTLISVDTQGSKRHSQGPHWGSCVQHAALQCLNEARVWGHCCIYLHFACHLGPVWKMNLRGHKNLDMNGSEKALEVVRANDDEA